MRKSSDDMKQDTSNESKGEDNHWQSMHPKRESVQVVSMGRPVLRTVFGYASGRHGGAETRM